MDGMLRPRFPREGRLHTETRRTRVRLICGCERVFLAEIHVVIDIESDPAILEGLTDEGLQRFNCPRCDQIFDLAEPILVHDRERARTALFVPSAIGHRALVFHAELAAEIATADPAAIPAHAFQPELLVGVQGLREWLFGPGARSRVPLPRQPGPGPVHPAASAAGDPARHPSAPVVQARPSGPPLHAAFTDLAQADSQRPSTVPTAPEIDDVDEDEPMFADDWLARDTRAPVVPEPDPPAQVESDATSPPFTRPGRTESTVDFAGLLDDDEDEEDDIEEENFVEEMIEEEDGDEPSPEAEIIVMDDAEADDAAAGQSAGIPATAGKPAAEAVRDAPGPILGGAERCLELGEDGLVLSLRLPAARVALFDPSTADLWFQLLDVGGTPLMAITLVSDPTMDRPHWVTWPIDPRRGPDREVTHALRRSYRAEIRLYDENTREAARFPLSADRELNVSVVTERAARVLDAGPVDDAAASAALAGLTSSAQPFGTPLPPLFTSYGLPVMEGFEQTQAVLTELAHWLEPDRYEHLVLVRSLPLDYLEEIVVEVLDQAVGYGVRLPERLRDRAITLGHAPNRADLCRVLAANFDRLMVAGDGPPDEVAARNWRDLLTDCAVENVTWEPRIRDRAEELLEAHGLLDQATIREAEAALAAPDGLETDQLLRMLQHRRLRAGAIAALCGRAEPAAWKEAVRAVDRLDAAAALDATRAIARLREAVTGEITVLLGSDRPHVRQAAAALLGGLALRRTLMPILKALGSEPTPGWVELARAVAATGSAAVRSIERQLTDERFPLERLALAVRLLDQVAPKASARFEAMADSGDERAARMMELSRSATIEPSRVSPAERYGELLRRAIAGEAISAREATVVVEAYRAALAR
jgi:hypothetical protein